MHSPIFDSNYILAGLPPEEQRKLSAAFKLIEIKSGTMLQEDGVEIEQVYFPVSGLVSILIAVTDGNMVETALVGREGVVNSFAGIGLRKGFNRSVVQISGSALQIDAQSFAGIVEESPQLRARIDRYHAFLLVQAQQTAACNLLHPLEARLCRWLAQARDRVERDSFDLTQEFVAQMLGVTRPTVNIALGQLKEEKLITTHRGGIEVLDHKGLVANACECYGLLKQKMHDII
jgi:CRP-like cAMP-binding protein